ncbi:hypothetical protein CKO23_07855 [Thiocystis violacea]|nr:hypothetical protein [Thiocystis violacea]
MASTIALMMALPAQAAPKGHDIDARLDRQQTTIDRGINSGELTKREAGILRQEHREIRDLARSLRRDWSRETYRRLDRKLDRSERHIRSLASNDEVRRPRNAEHRPQPHPDSHARADRGSPPSHTR